MAGEEIYTHTSESGTRLIAFLESEADRLRSEGKSGLFALLMLAAHRGIIDAYLSSRSLQSQEFAFEQAKKIFEAFARRNSIDKLTESFWDGLEDVDQLAKHLPETRKVIPS